MSQLADDDFEITFKDKKCTVNKRSSSSGVIVSGRRGNGHYE